MKREPPVFVEKPRITSQRDGKLIVMECLVKSTEKPTISWSKEGRSISETTRIKKTVKTQKDDVYLIQLELSDPDFDDAGLYKCNVKNSHGETNANLTLNVECKSKVNDDGDTCCFLLMTPVCDDTLSLSLSL